MAVTKEEMVARGNNMKWNMVFENNGKKSNSDFQPLPCGANSCFKKAGAGDANDD